MIRIVTDAAADLPAYAIQESDIQFVTGTVSLGGETLRTGPDLASLDFYTRWRETGDLPVASEPTVEEITAAYQAILGDQPSAAILSIHESGRLCETVQRARVAAAACAPARIHIFDSQSTSAGLGLLVREAARMVKERRDVGPIVTTLEHLRAGLRGFVVMETLETLKRDRRLSGMERLIGGLLSVRPILSLRGGEVTLVDQRRTRAEALQKLSEMVVQSGWGRSNLRIGIAHAVCEQDALALARDLTAALKPEVLLVGEYGAGNSLLGGPGTLAAFWVSPR